MTTSCGRVRAVAAVLTAAAAVTAAGSLSGQEDVRHATARHARGTMIAAAVRVPLGTADDPPGMEGAVRLLAQERLAALRRSLDPAVAEATLTVGRNATTYTVLAVPSSFPDVVQGALGVLIDAPVSPQVVAAERDRLLSILSFEEGAPTATFEAEASALLAEGGDPWARPPQGTPASLEAVTIDELERLHRAHYRRELVRTAWAGPLPADTAAPPSGPGRAAPAAAPPTAAADAPPATPDTVPPPPARQAWTMGHRSVVVREVTNAWIRVAYPAPSDLPRTYLELLAFLVRETVDPVPPPPDEFFVDVHLEDPPGGPVLVVDASVLPEAADAWEARILGAVKELSAREMAPGFFQWRRRRFRTHRLLEEARPEVEATRMTEDLSRRGRVRDLENEIWALDPGALHRAARSLGEPRILRIGPDLGPDRSGGR